MYITIFVAVFTMLTSVFMAGLLKAQSDQKLEQSITGDRIGTTYSREAMSSPFKGTTFVLGEATRDKEIVTKTLMRICTHLYAKAKDNGCVDPNLPSTVWSFAGTVNSTGDLAPAWTGTTANAFSCAGIDEYGRGLLQQSLPVSFIQGRNLQYDFTAMGLIDKSDPCGFSEIIDID